MVCPPSRCLISPCLQWSPIVSPHVCLCWMACPPSRRLVSPCLPLSPHMRTYVGLFVRLPEVLSPLGSHCLPLSTIVSLCLPLSPFLSPRSRPPDVLSPPCLPSSPFAFPCVGWCVCLPKVLSPCLPTCLSSWFPSGLLRFLKVSALVLDGVSAFSRSCLPSCLPACLSSCFPLWRVVSFYIFFPSSVRLGFLMLSHVFDPVPQKQFLNPPTVWGLRWCNFKKQMIRNIILG